MRGTTPRAAKLSSADRRPDAAQKNDSSSNSQPFGLATRAGFAGPSLEPYSWEGYWGRGCPPPDQIGIPQSGNQRSSSGSIGSSAAICALSCSSRSVARSPGAPSPLPVVTGTNGYQKPRL